MGSKDTYPYHCGVEGDMRIIYGAKGFANLWMFLIESLMIVTE